jgi:hypothetical protein
MASAIRPPKSESHDKARGEIRERQVLYASHSAERDVLLAGLGAKAKAQERGDESFWELVEAGRELGEGAPVDQALADFSRDILTYANALDHLVRERRSFERMVEAMLPETLLPTSPAVLQARRNAEARLALISEFGLLGSGDIAQLAGSRAKNRASLAHRWKQEGRLFSVNYKGASLFPAFQFDEQGRPRPVISEVIRTLGSKSREWELALWFIGNTGWLDGERPVDLLESDPEAVAEAARSEAEDLVY